MGIGRTKRTQNISREELKNILAVARGEKEADLIITDVTLLDLINGDSLHTNVALSGRHIAGIGSDYQGKNVFPADGLTIVPGFIDSHLHIESSMMHPFAFERLTLPLGLTTIFCDPHEITNVLGEKGFSWFLRCAELAHQNIFVQMSSCVPALPGFETNAGEFGLDKNKLYIDHPHVVGLAEMMNFPGVINAVDEVLDKLEAYSDMNLDGHCPLVTGKDLNAYIAAGIQNCHETVTLKEGREKLQKGMAVMIREGTVAKNLKTLAPLINEATASNCLLCTDDRNPYEIYKEGHLNYLIKELINTHKVKPYIAYRVASYSAAKHFGLKRLGLIAPGYLADFVLLKNVEKVEIQEVFVGGKQVSTLKLDESLDGNLKKSGPPVENTIRRKKVSGDDFDFIFEKGTYNVIEVIPNEIITNHLKINFTGDKFVENDILKISVVERYGKNLKPSAGLVKGFNLKSGAIASSVAHDSHNIVVVGINEEEMAAAVNALIESGGGFCVVDKGKVKSILSLPIAGLLSLDSAENIAKNIEHLKDAYHKLGGKLIEPFLQLAFLALPVIPSLKITDQGLMDVAKFSFIDLKIS